MEPDAIELCASYWSIAGDVGCAEPNEVSPFDFRTRVEVASRTGFRGMGFVHADLMAVSAKLGYAEMKRILDDNGIRHVEVEIVMDWFTDGERRAASNRVRSDLFRAAEALGAHHVKIGGSLEDNGNKVWPRETLARDFAAICAEAKNIGTLIALEPMPFTNLRSIRQGVEMIRDSGATNGGLMLDIWHLARGGIDFADITWMPKELIYWVEIDDAAPEVVDNLWIDTIHHRKLPGEGSLDIQAFLSRVFDTGYSGPFGVEIISLTHRKLSLEEQTRRVYETSMRQFETALAARQPAAKAG